MNNYYEIKSYCKSEGLDTDYFLNQLGKHKKRSVSKKLRSLQLMIKGIAI